MLESEPEALQNSSAVRRFRILLFFFSHLFLLVGG